jgi:hypothetical protein
MSDRVSPIRPYGGIMSEFELLARICLRKQGRKKSCDRKMIKS